MPHLKNATIIRYEILNNQDNEVSIRIFPLINSRHFHSVTNRDELTWKFIQKPSTQGVTVHTSVPLSTIILSSSYGKYFAGNNGWTDQMHFRVDHARGNSFRDTSFQPGWFEFSLAPEEKKKFHVIAAAGKTQSQAQRVFTSVDKDVDVLHNREAKRREDLLAKFHQDHTDIMIEDWLKWIILATDSFIVNRKLTKRRSVIAGYHWFEDWGRDSLISLPGLTLITARFEDAKQILLNFGHYCHRGLIPNRFPDKAAEKPDYNTVDATLVLQRCSSIP